MYARGGFWSRYAGPAPGMRGCRAPLETLAKYGIGIASGERIRKAGSGCVEIKPALVADRVGLLITQSKTPQSGWGLGIKWNPKETAPAFGGWSAEAVLVLPGRSLRISHPAMYGIGS
jgi:hypothetical protein